MALAVVQSKFVNIASGSGPFTITFSSPLTVGNTCYLMLMGGYFNVTGSFPATGWNLESQNGSGGSGNTQYLLSRVVQGGDGATPPAFIVSTNAGFQVIGVEISGGPTVEAITKSTSEASPIAGPTTVANNCLGMRFSGANGGFGTYGPGTGWTNQQYNASASTIGDTTTSVVASGTDLSGAVTNTAGGTTGHWMVISLKVASISYTLPIDTGAYSYTGVVFGMITPRRFSFTSGSYSVEGRDVILTPSQHYHGSIAELSNTSFMDWTNADYSSFMAISQSDDMVDVKEQTPYIYTFLKQTDTSDANSEGALLTGYWDFANDPSSVRVTAPQEIYQYHNGFLLSARKHKIRGRGRQLQIRYDSETGKNFNLLGWALFYEHNAKQ